MELPALVTRDLKVVTITLEQAETLLQRFGTLVVDIEHTGYPVGHKDHWIKTVQIGTKDFCVVLDAQWAADQVLIRKILAGMQVMVSHSGMAECVPLANAGLGDFDRMLSILEDTVIPVKLANPAQVGDEAGLKAVAEYLVPDPVSPKCDKDRGDYFKENKWLTDVEVTTDIARSGWANCDIEDDVMVRYAAADVLDTGAIREYVESPPEALLVREQAVQRIIAPVSYRGIRIDREHTHFIREKVLEDKHAAVKGLAQFGITKPGSKPQQAKALESMGITLPKTAPSSRYPNGQASVKATVLNRLKAHKGPWQELVQYISDYRVAENRLGLFLNPYMELCDRGDGRARPTIYTLEAETGRMSCRRPNLQQVPREGGYRACLTADPGHLIVSADFSSVEIRVACALSQDGNLRSMLESGADIHGIIARELHGENWTAADRYKVKRAVFAWLYGGGDETIADDQGISIETVKRLKRILGNMMPTLVEWTNSVRTYTRQGYTRFPTYSGRVVFFNKQLPHKSSNYAIQGTARELLVDALLRWRETEFGNCTVLPVHDEIVAFVPENKAPAAISTLISCMTTNLYGIDITAEAKEPSFYWKDAA